MNNKQPTHTPAPGPKSPVRGLKVRTVNLLMILLSGLVYVILLLATFRAAKDYRSMVSATELYILCQQEAALASDGSDYLTEQVRLFTVKPDAACAENYFTEVNVTRRRDQALEHLNGQASPQAQGYLELALDYSNQLMGREIYAMRLAAEAQSMDLTSLPQEIQNIQLSETHRELSAPAKAEQARELVFGQEYQAKKQLITSNIDFFLTDVMGSTQRGLQQSVNGLERSMRLERILSSALFLMNVFIFVMIAFLIVKPLQVYVKCIREEKLMEITGAYEFKYLALTYNDIYEINTANEILLRHQAEHDALTGIINRGAFEQIKEVLRVKCQPIALLLVDVDKFKLVNDGFGHEVGDLVLQKVARLLKESFRATDYPARIGGDEFAVILTEISAAQQSRIEQKLNHINEALLTPMDGLPQVSLSIGGAFSPAGYTDDLYRQADKALYQVKENGRCGVNFAPSPDQEELASTSTAEERAEK